MNENNINIAQYKILKTISLLNENNYYPLPEGVYKILSGQNDDEMKEFKDLITYSTLISYSSKRITLMITILSRHKFLERIYDKNTDKIYLKISNRGEGALSDYEKNHKVNLKKKIIKNDKTIVKLFF